MEQPQAQQQPQPVQQVLQPQQQQAQQPHQQQPPQAQQPEQQQPEQQPGATVLPGLPATYRRLVARKTAASFGDAAEVVESPLPLPGPGEVLVRMAFAGVNGGCETFRARGEHAFAANRSKPEFALGAEGAGTVVALGPGVAANANAPLALGQGVACNGAGAFAEFALLPAAACTPLPGPPTPEVVALALSAVTAAAALEVTARVQPGEVVCVTAAAGGTGHFAVQLAQLAGARVVAIAGGAAKAAALAALGVECVIDHQHQDVSAVLAERFPGGVDVVYEGVGGPLRAAVLRHLAPGARILQVGYISQYPHAGCAAVDKAENGAGLDEVFWGGQTLSLGEGRTLYGQVWPKDVRAIRACRTRVFELHREGKLAAWTDTSHGFTGVAGAAGAVDYMLRGGHIGKVVLPL